MSRTEKVKKILRKLVIEYEKAWIPATGKTLSELAKEICQLFPSSTDNPDGYKLKIGNVYCPRRTICFYVDCSHGLDHQKSEEFCRLLPYNPCPCKPKPEESKPSVLQAQMAIDRAREAGIKEVMSDIVGLMDCRLSAETFAIKVADYCEIKLCPYLKGGQNENRRENQTAPETAQDKRAGGKLTHTREQPRESSDR